MIRFVYILFSLYLLTGSVLLPRGDFSTLGEVADMYRHCKETEDKDMGLEDFITEHVFNLKIEDIFEKHRDEKQHSTDKSSPYQHTGSNNIQMLAKAIERFIPGQSVSPFIADLFFASNDYLISENFATGIFRPPVLSPYFG